MEESRVVSTVMAMPCTRVLHMCMKKPHDLPVFAHALASFPMMDELHSHVECAFEEEEERQAHDARRRIRAMSKALAPSILDEEVVKGIADCAYLSTLPLCVGAAMRAYHELDPTDPRAEFFRDMVVLARRLKAWRPRLATDEDWTSWMETL